MNVTVYADTLVFLNTFVTYFLLMSAQVLCRRPAKRLRVLAASLLGGIYALTLLLKPMPLLVSFAVRVAVCMALRLICERFCGIRVFLKGAFVFLLLNGVYAGMMLLCRTFVPQMLFAGGVVYLDVSVPFLLLSTLAIYLCIRFAARLFCANPSRTHNGTVKICVGDRSVSGSGIFDTGNHLSDGFTGKPVLIVRPSFVQPLLPQGVSDFLTGKELSACNIPPEWRKRLRLFPYSSVGSDGLLPAFRCDRAVVSHATGSCTKEKLYIAVSPRPLYHGETDALFPEALYEEITEGENRHESSNACPSPFYSANTFKMRTRAVLHQRSADASAAARQKGRIAGFAATRLRRRVGARNTDRT